MTETTIMRAHGEITLPERIREAARLEENDPLAVELTPEGILLKPIAMDPDQAWYWTLDGRATSSYGASVIPGEPHIIWRRIGTHDIFRDP